MLKCAITHPELLSLLGECGHGDKILIADGNYPAISNTHEQTRRVFLNLTHGIPLVTDVLSAIHETIAIEKAEVMIPDDGEEPAIFAEFRRLLGPELPLHPRGRFDFYGAGKEPNVKIAVVTGEQRIYANVLITMGVVQRH
ncbi:RbsD/FucU family protein [Paenibacillus sp. MBLB4367]|uniref:RbsD/FucU family protein n=1 Tax=Paenibacillus sp. MBLB4367 TaxID=3384767 RepID=UPI0039083606